MAESPQPSSSAPDHRSFAARVATALLLVSLFVALVLALWKASQVILLFFAAVLLAVILRTAANAVARWTGLRTRWALLLVLVVGSAATAAAVWVAAPRVAAQFEALRGSVTGSVESVSKAVEGLPAGEKVMEKAADVRHTMLNGGDLWNRATGIFSNTLGVISGIFIVVFVGGFIAFDPRLYLAGMIRLLPPEKRARGCEVINALGHTLQGWLIGQLISMAFLFATTWIMLGLLGVPLAFILALLTGIVTFVPYVGPLLALIPILLVAFVENPTLALYTGLLYLLIQNVEGSILMPLVFQRMVHLPAALSIAGQLVLGGIFGVLGFILATPLTAVVMVLVQKLYVEDVLDDSLEDEVREIPELKGGT